MSAIEARQEAADSRKAAQMVKKNLVFSSVGDHSKHRRYWLRSKAKKHFDLWLCYYGDEVNRYANDGERYEQRKGSKWQNFSHFLKQYGETINAYDCVLVLDDDIEITTERLNEFFALFHAFALELAQPAYTTSSRGSWPLLKQRAGYRLRYTNFVECSVPAFSRAALIRCAAPIADAVRGSGLDYVCAHIIQRDGEGKIAVIDQTPCRHRSRQSELDRLVLPRSYMPIERDRLLAKYGVKHEAPRILPGGVRRTTVPLSVYAGVYAGWAYALLGFARRVARRKARRVGRTMCQWCVGQ